MNAGALRYKEQVYRRIGSLALSLIKSGQMVRGIMANIRSYEWIHVTTTGLLVNLLESGGMYRKMHGERDRFLIYAASQPLGHLFSQCL
jgi:hypothetical protein